MTHMRPTACFSTSLSLKTRFANLQYPKTAYDELEMAKRVNDLQGMFRLDDAELNLILKAKPLLLSKKENKLPDTYEFYRVNFGYTIEMFKLLVVRHPKILSIPHAKVKEVYDFFLAKGMTQTEISQCVVEIPKTLEQSEE